MKRVFLGRPQEKASMWAKTAVANERREKKSISRAQLTFFYKRQGICGVACPFVADVVRKDLCGLTCFVPT